MKVAVIGLGAMGRSHVKTLRELKVVTEILGCDVSEPTRRTAEADGVRTVDDLEKVMKWKPDAVFVVTPPCAHVAGIEPCLKAGIPTFTEKPLAHNIRDCRRMVALAERLKVPFQVGFELRYSGILKSMREVVKSGLVGRPLNMELVQISGPHPKGVMTRERVGGIFWEKLCHQVDIYRYWFGEPERVMAVTGPNAIRHYGVPDNVLACMVFPDGRTGKITFFTTRAAQVGGTDDHGDRGHFYELCLTCTKGSLTFCAWSELLSVVRFNHRADCKSELVERIPVRERYGEPSYSIAPQDEDFLMRVKSGRKLQFPAADALKSMEWVDRAERSLAAGGKWIR